MLTMDSETMDREPPVYGYLVEQRLNLHRGLYWLTSFDGLAKIVQGAKSLGFGLGK